MDNSNPGYKNMAIKTRTTVITTTTTPESLPKNIFFDINRHRNNNNNNNNSNNNHQAVLNGKFSFCPKVDARPPFSLTSKHSSYLKFFSLPPSPPLLNFTTLYCTSVESFNPRMKIFVIIPFLSLLIRRRTEWDISCRPFLSDCKLMKKT